MMGANSKIEWTDHTFNPWVGCQKVSTGCQYCYAERDMTRKPRWANAWGPPGTSDRLRTKTWNQPLAWNRKAAKDGTRPKVFCASLADIFERNNQLLDWRFDLWDLVEQTPNLDWLLLTKRPENILDMVPWKWKHDKWPNHVWMGTSVEDQETANERIPELLKVDTTVCWVSAEPLLGPIDFDKGNYGSTGFWIDKLNWIIVGGESGPHARPMDPDWARDIRDQCQPSGTPYFFKQMSKKAPIPDDLMIREFPLSEKERI